MFKTRSLFIAAFICCIVPSSASASQVANLQAGFSPDKLGASTTILVNFTIGTTTGAIPSPLTNVDLKLPNGVGLGTTTLGTAVCMPKVLEADGPSGCPSNALMGYGDAAVKVPIGPDIVDEPVSLTILMGPPTDGHTAMLFYADGVSPVSAQIVFSSLLLSETGAFGAHLVTSVPLTPSVPGAPDAAVVSMHSSLGPQGVTYQEQEHGRLISYHPIGMAVPEKCPHYGFPFFATFTFQDGTQATAKSSVPCPRDLARTRKGR